MSGAGPTPNASTDQSGITEEARNCVLWTPDSDFSKVCSCEECLPKIESLNEFQNEIKAKTRLVSGYDAQMQDKEDLCVTICLSIKSTKELLKFLEKKLKEVSENSGVPSTLEKSSSIDILKDMYEKIAVRLRCVGLLDDGWEDMDLGDNDDNDDIFDKIDTALFCYWETKAKDKGCVLLQEIGNLEKDWEMDKNTDEAHKLEKQIKLVKKLPVEELKHEAEELMAEILPREFHWMLNKARQCIYNACYSCIRKRKEFWKGSPVLTEGNEHSSNGLKETLDSLIKVVNLFKEKWNEEFAPVFTPHN